MLWWWTLEIQFVEIGVSDSREKSSQQRQCWQWHYRVWRRWCCRGSWRAGPSRRWPPQQLPARRTRWPGWRPTGPAAARTGHWTQRSCRFCLENIINNNLFKKIFCISMFAHLWILICRHGSVGVCLVTGHLSHYRGQTHLLRPGLYLLWTSYTWIILYAVYRQSAAIRAMHTRPISSPAWEY